MLPTYVPARFATAIRFGLLGVHKPPWSQIEEITSNGWYQWAFYVSFSLLEVTYNNLTRGLRETTQDQLDWRLTLWYFRFALDFPTRLHWIFVLLFVSYQPCNDATIYIAYFVRLWWSHVWPTVLNNCFNNVSNLQSCGSWHGEFLLHFTVNFFILNETTMFLDNSSVSDTLYEWSE